MQLLPILQQELVAAQGAQRLFTAAQSSARLQLLPATHKGCYGLSVVLFPCPVIQTSSKEQKWGWLLSVESSLLPPGHWAIDLEIFFAEILY